MGSILYLHTAPSCGGNALFASQYAAYDALSPRTKVYLQGLTATHSGDHIYRCGAVPNRSLGPLRNSFKTTLIGRSRTSVGSLS
jgi:alpha-ketoglutarate-dependent taurine dioxygenase